MKPTLLWVLGRGGLLGSSLANVLPAELPTCLWPGSGGRLRWDDLQEWARDIAEAARAFLLALAPPDEQEWIVIWAAGAGVVDTTEQELASETLALRLLLSEIDSQGLCDRPGWFFLASSAGGIHAGDPVLPVTERSQPAPLSAYGRAKLEQELLVASFCENRPLVRSLIGRFSNLYGPGQNLHKAQGYISRVCRSALTGEPLHVYVPLDTARDFLFSDDAARAVARLFASFGNDRVAVPAVCTKLIASERSVSLAVVAGLLPRIVKRPMRIIAARQAKSHLQPLRLAFRSVVYPVPPAQTPLPAGIAVVLAELRSALRAGHLPPATR